MSSGIQPKKIRFPVRTRHDVIFEYSLKMIKNSNELMENGEFSEAIKLFMEAIKIIENNHWVEALRRQEGWEIPLDP